MYLKEAFRYQNYLNELISATTSYLNGGQYTTKTVQEHLRKKANPDAENETIDLSAERALAYTANQMVDFLQHLIDEKQKLTKAISEAKKGCSIDIDAEVANNRIRQSVAATLSRMGNMKPSERMTRAYAYKFNAEGNQVQYAYEVKEVTTIDFDRNKVKGISKKLIQCADEASTAIDKAMVELAVDYNPNYSVNDSFEDAIEQFLTPAA
jgi:hypothetical protein